MMRMMRMVKMMTMRMIIYSYCNYNNFLLQADGCNQLKHIVIQQIIHTTEHTMNQP